jgi:hypothetical protein
MLDIFIEAGVKKYPDVPHKKEPLYRKGRGCF